MALSLPRPSAVLDRTKFVVGQAVGSAAALAAQPGRLLALPGRVLAVPGRVLGLLDGAEALVKRIDTVVDRAETAIGRAERVLDEAEETVRQVGAISTAASAAVDEAARIAGTAGSVVTEAQRVASRATTTMARAELISTTADELLTAYETTLRKGAPMASRFVAQLSPEEVDAAIRLVDELPKLTEHVTSDVLPILATLDRVGPDIHELLEVTRDLRLAVAGIPGLKRLARRGDRLSEADGNS
jgi:hypothetical protein